jgi:hypothetical protein
VRIPSLNNTVILNSLTHMPHHEGQKENESSLTEQMIVTFRTST